jgi:hypothetical protein
MKNKIERYKVYLILLVGVLLTGVGSAEMCKDIFYNTEDNYTICGYCYEENGSVCFTSRQCNFSIYYENGTNIVYEINTTNQGDGSFTYNLSNSTPIGNYFGFMFCDNRSYDTFSFQILSPSTPSYTGSSGYYPSSFIDCYYIEDNNCLSLPFMYVCPSSYYPNEEICLSQLSTEPRVIQDFKVTLNNIYSAISPSNKLYGGLFLIVILLSFIFWRIFKKSKKKVVKKEWK